MFDKQEQKGKWKNYGITLRRDERCTDTAGMGTVRLEERPNGNE